MDTFSLEILKVLLAVRPMSDGEQLVSESFKLAAGLVGLLDAPVPGGEGPSITSEFDESPQGVADAVLGRAPVSVSGVDHLPMGSSSDSFEKEFL
jgi:hypothetical protein